MSYYRRGYSWEDVEYIPAPTAGWNPDATTWELPNTEAPVLDNFLIRPGKIMARGAFSHLCNISASAPNPVGLVSAGALCVSDMSAVGCMPWDAPMLGTSTGRLAQASTTLTWTDALGVKQTSTVASRHLVPGPRWINFDGELYGLGFDSEATALQDKGASYFMSATQLLTQPFTASGASGNTNGIPFTLSGTNWGSDGHYNASLATAATTSVLDTTSAGILAPAGATITSLSVKVPVTAGNFTSFNITAQLEYAGAVIGSASTKAISGFGVPVFSYANFGSPALTVTQVNASTFGVRFTITNTSGSTSPSGTYQISTGLNISVSYTVPYSTPTTTALTNAPQGAVDLTGHLSALWLLGGTNVQDASHYHSATSLYYTNAPLAAGGGAATSDWVDPASGLANVIRLDQDSSDPGVALASTRNGLIIFRRNSTWVLKGSTPSNFTVVELAHDTGCLDPRSVVETDAGVYFVGQKGLFVTDGSRVTNVSGAVMYTLQQAIAAQQWNVITGHGGYITAALTTGGQIMLTLGARTSTGGLQPIWAAMYDTSLRAWVRITSSCWSDDGSQGSSSNYYPSLLISDRLGPLRSLHAVGSKYVTLIEDQSLAYSFLNQSSLYDARLDGTTPAIPLAWKTRFMPIIGTTTLRRKWGQAKRFFLDYSFTVSGGTVTPGTSVGWTVTPVDATDTVWDALAIMSTDVENSTMVSSISAGYGLGSTRAIQRANLDFVSEVDDLAFDITYADASTNSSASGVIAAVYGVGVEYQPTRDKR